MSVLEVMGVLIFVDAQHGTSASASVGLSILEAKLSMENGAFSEWCLQALGYCVIGIADDMAQWSCGIFVPVESIVALKSVAPMGVAMG